jgi:hypothetical protein
MFARGLSLIAILGAGALTAGCTTLSLSPQPRTPQQQTGSASAPASQPAALPAPLPAPPVCGRDHAAPNCPG